MAPLKRVEMKATGMAELTFVRKEDAQAIVTKYDGAPLDGTRKSCAWCGARAAQFTA